MQKGSQAVLMNLPSPAPSAGEGEQDGCARPGEGPRGMLEDLHCSWWENELGAPTAVPRQGNTGPGLPASQQDEPKCCPCNLHPPSPASLHSGVFKGHFGHAYQTQILNYYFKWWVSYSPKHLPCTEAENGQPVVSFMKLFLSFWNQSGKPLMAWAFFSLSVTMLMILI